jgi:transcriptional regulator with XRE-family HTH domain
MKHALPERLRLLRLEKRLTQEAMASAILVPRVTYTHYELGKRTPDLDTILRLAEYHNVSVDFLVGATWLRPPLEKYLASRSDDMTAGTAMTYPQNGEASGLKVADSPNNE